jgi:glycolate oxidase
VNHILGLEVVDERGEVFATSIDDAGYDLTAALVGSEGTLGIVGSAWVKLLQLPESVRVWVAAFGDIDAASEAVSAIVGAGIIPTALEMMDSVIVKAVEAAFHSGYPTDAAAVLLIENAGFEDDMDACEAAIHAIVHQHGAISWRSAHSQAERDILWAGRKGAAGSTGRISPNYYTQDLCVPRSKLPLALRAVEEAAGANNIVVGNVFHAGDGNLHPLVLYDQSVPGQEEKALELSYRILRLCVDNGGSITGEHGVGKEKQEALGYMFSEPDLATMQLVRCAFDPENIANPDKVFPRPRLCAEKPGPYTPHPLETAGIAEIF